MRLFTAVNFSEELKDSLSGVISALKKQGVSGSFSQRDNLHLTLVFIGETGRVSDVRAAMDAVTGKPFSLTLSGLGTFRRDGGDILWVGVKAEAELYAVQRQLADGLMAAGFDIDTRAYKPHLTLGREVRFPAEFDLAAFSAGVPALSVKAHCVSLMKSERVGGRLIYTEMDNRKLVQV